MPAGDAVGEVAARPRVEGAVAATAGATTGAARMRRSLSIAEREMIISLFFNENRTIREVADFMHLAKSTGDFLHIFPIPIYSP